ncbi:uncharacterized protein LOC129794814 [Lutzomyia longipalpis]|uniref:uncharacterized protein LOC129794814 n=1 Tax=Lutzomyia longipalpis TaxID=7200 RepID=UPI0024842E95|nr:uncharacterized protein LOC129794814 [Lutzomyia longipalpis]
MWHPKDELRHAFTAWGVSKPSLIACRLHREGITLGHLMMLRETDLERIFCEQGDTHLLIEMRFVLQGLKDGSSLNVKSTINENNKSVSKKVNPSGQGSFYGPQDLWAGGPPSAGGGPSSSGGCSCTYNSYCLYHQ